MRANTPVSYPTIFLANAWVQTQLPHPCSTTGTTRLRNSSNLCWAGTARLNKMSKFAATDFFVDFKLCEVRCTTRCQSVSHPTLINYWIPHKVHPSHHTVTPHGANMKIMNHVHVSFWGLHGTLTLGCLSSTRPVDKIGVHWLHWKI